MGESVLTSIQRLLTTVRYCHYKLQPSLQLVKQETPMQIFPAGISQTAPGESTHMTGATASVAAMPWGAPGQAQSLDSDIGQRFLQAVSDKTGISKADLTAQLQGGATLKDILKSKNVSFGEIRAAVRGQSGKVQSSGHHHRHHTGGPDASADAVLQSLAAVLGMDQKDLVQQLQSGKALDQLASDKGLTQDDLLKAVQQALQNLGSYTQDSAPNTTTPLHTNQVNEVV
jgi:uncharacterized protein YidB (DUF937 family)